MSRILSTHPKSVQGHKDLILQCLDDKDESIRLRALDLLYGMVTKKNLMEIVKKLMVHMDKAEGSHYRDELLSKIVVICSQSNYQFVTNFEWSVDSRVGAVHCLSVCLSISFNLSVHLSHCVCACPSLFLCVSVCPPLSHCVCLSLTVCLPVHFSLSLCLCLSTALSLYPCLSISLWLFLALCLSLSLAPFPLLSFASLLIASVCIITK